MSKTCLTFAILSILTGLYGCRPVPDFLKECPSGFFVMNERTNISLSMSIEGYYIPTDCADSTYFPPLLFHNDGTVGELTFKKREFEKERVINFNMYGNTVVAHLKSIPYTYCNSGGHYVLSGDTLIIDKYREIRNDKLASTKWSLTKLKFIIEDRHHIRLIQSQHFSKRDNKLTTVSSKRLFEFVPVKKTLPFAGVGIKNLWFVWKDKKEFRKWKKHIKMWKKEEGGKSYEISN